MHSDCCRVLVLVMLGLPGGLDPPPIATMPEHHQCIGSRGYREQMGAKQTTKDLD